MNATLLLAALLAADPARPPIAATTPEPASAPATETTGWYGAAAAIADAASITLLVTGTALYGKESKESTGSSFGGAAVALAIPGFELAGPIVHGHYRHYGRAVASVGLRLAGSIAGLYVWAIHNVHHCTENTIGPGCGAFNGTDLTYFAAPFIVVALLDDFVLARGPSPPRPARQRASSSATLTPVVGPGLALLSFSARF